MTFKNTLSVIVYLFCYSVIKHIAKGIAIKKEIKHIPHIFM
jgi:hypothetical protein